MKTKLKETTVALHAEDGHYALSIVHNDTGSAVGVCVSFEELAAIHDLIEKMIVR